MFQRRALRLSKKDKSLSSVLCSMLVTPGQVGEIGKKDWQ